MYLLSCLFKAISNIVVKSFWRIISKFTIKVTWKAHSITRDVVPVCCDWWIMWPSLFDILNLDRGARVVQWGRSLDLTTRTSLSSIRRGFTLGFVNYKKGCTRLAAASDKVYQLLVHGRWFSPDTPASSTTKTGRHNIAEILLKVALNTKNQNQNQFRSCFDILFLLFLLCISYLYIHFPKVHGGKSSKWY